MPANLYREKELTALSAEFPVEDVKQRAGRGNVKLDYIPIETTIGRLNSVLGAAWDAELVEASVYPIQDGEYFAMVTLQLKALGSTRCGVGASQGKDPDDAIKIAQAEALKKAGNLFGIGLYLWDAEKRDEIAIARTARKNGSKTSKKRTTIQELDNPLTDDAEEWEGAASDFPVGF